MKKSELRQLIREEIQKLNKTSIKDQINLIISKVPKEQKSAFIKFKKMTPEKLMKYTKTDKKMLDKKYKGDIEELRLILIKTWFNASPSDDFNLE